VNTNRLRQCLAACVLLAAPLLSHAARDGEAVVIGRQYEIRSQVLHEKRTYYVHKPARYDASKDSFPLVVVLDGETQFQHTSTSVDFLAANGRIPDMIVVGIANTDRDRDLTPPLTTPPEPGRVAEGKIGGAKQFLGFIADELIPALERKYRTRAYRILIGHSYGGLFATYTLLNRPDVFNAYIAISPSLGWDHEALVKSAEQFVADHKDLRASWYMTIGNERSGMPGGAVSKFIGILQDSPMRLLHSGFQRWPEETHGSVPLRSIYDGLQFVFDDWYASSQRPAGSK